MHIPSADGRMRTITINKKIRLWLLSGLLLLPFPATAEIMPQIALYHHPKYEHDFTHFDYADPQARKGGRIVMPEYGGFDNFNPFIFKGNATPQVANLSLDSLGIVPADDPATVYPLVAKAFDLPEDNSYVGFLLDERAKFQDGTPITADDVIFSYKALTEKGQPLYIMQMWSGWKKLIRGKCAFISKKVRRTKNCH